MEFERREAPYLAPTANVAGIMQQVLLALAQLHRRSRRRVGVGVEIEHLLAVEAVGLNLLVDDARRHRPVVTCEGKRHPCTGAITAVDVLLETAVFLAGVDEAGRGPLAGPIVAAAVLTRPIYFAGYMLRCGEADGLVSGCISTTASVVERRCRTR